MGLCQPLWLQYAPVARGGDEVQAAVHPVIWHLSSVHPRFSVQEILTLAVDVVDDWLPAAGGKERVIEE